MESAARMVGPLLDCHTGHDVRLQVRGHPEPRYRNRHRQLDNGFPTSVEGILGFVNVRAAALTRGIVSDFQLVPTVFDDASEQDQITAKVIRFAFAPASQFLTPKCLPALATDSSQAKSVLAISPASNYSLDMPVTYGSDTSILNSIVGIVGTGTTLVLLATDAFEAYETANGAVFCDGPTGLL
ncbi:hypothetical protein V8D89_014483 [Ganoderma adspersum]